MAWNTPDVWSEPEKFGLEIVGVLDDQEACYSFDYIVLFYHAASGKLYWGTDAGCSCPSPFENFNNGVEDLTELRLGDPLDDFVRYMYQEWGGKASDVDKQAMHLRALRIVDGRMAEAMSVSRNEIFISELDRILDTH